MSEESDSDSDPFKTDSDVENESRLNYNVPSKIKRSATINSSASGRVRRGSTLRKSATFAATEMLKKKAKLKHFFAKSDQDKIAGNACNLFIVNQYILEYICLFDFCTDAYITYKLMRSPNTMWAAITVCAMGAP